MNPLPRNAARLLDWLVISAMLIFASVSIGLVTLDLVNVANQGLSNFRIHWAEECVFMLFAVWGLVPVVSPTLALKSRRRAGWIWFLGCPPTWISMDFLLGAASGWADDQFVAIVVAVVLLAIGAFWFATSTRNWPPVITSLPNFSVRRSLAFVLAGILVCALSATWAVVVWEGPEQNKIVDCGLFKPFAEPTSSTQAVFVARDVMLFSPAPSAGDLSPNPFGNFAIARIQKQFWSPTGWNWKYLLIHRPFNWHGKDYFIASESPPRALGEASSDRQDSAMHVNIGRECGSGVSGPERPPVPSRRADYWAIESVPLSP